jgi:hypothetical protein
MKFNKVKCMYFINTTHFWFEFVQKMLSTLNVCKYGSNGVNSATEKKMGCHHKPDFLGSVCVLLKQSKKIFQAKQYEQRIFFYKKLIYLFINALLLLFNSRKYFLLINILNNHILFVPCFVIYRFGFFFCFSLL